MDYYSDDYPDISVEEFLAVYERLTTFARREVHELAALLAGGPVAEEDSWPLRARIDGASALVAPTRSPPAA